MIYLEKSIDGKKEEIVDASVQQVQKALNELYLTKNIEYDKVVLSTGHELSLEVYYNGVVFENFNMGRKDGPEWIGEMYRGRVNVNKIFDHAEEIVDMLEGYEEEELVELFKKLKEEK